MTIGIVHHQSTIKFLAPLAKSLAGVHYPIRIIANNQTPHKESFPFPVIYNKRGGFELGALHKLIASCPKEDDFFLLPETSIMKDNRIFDLTARYNGSFAMSPGFGSFTGKYCREILTNIGIPIPQSRKSAIFYEKFWHVLYMDTEPNMAIADDPLIDSEVFEEFNGRTNMVLENAYMKKWKSNWGNIKLSLPHIV